MNLDDIRTAIMLGDIDAAKVFTLMQQHVNAAYKRGFADATKGTSNQVCESCGHEVTDGNRLIQDGDRRVCLTCHVL